MEDEDQPIWVVYRVKNSKSFALLTTTKEVLWFFDKIEIIAEDVTYETANKIIGLTRGQPL